MPPTQPPRPCRSPGCPQLVYDGSGFCQAHAAQRGRAQHDRDYDHHTRANTPALAEAARIRSSAQWKKVARLHKAQCPVCCNVFHLHDLCPAPTQESHHIIPVAERPDLAFDLTNLAPLCHRCHGRIDGMEKRGEPTRHLFQNMPIASIGGFA